MSPAKIISDYIIKTLEKMTDPSDKSEWPLYISHLPDGTNVKTDCGAIYDAPGKMDSRSMKGSICEHQGIQLLIRSDDYNTGYKKIEDITFALDEVANDEITVDDENYQIQNVSRDSPVISKGTGWGTKRRFSFTINFWLTLKEIL